MYIQKYNSAFDTPVILCFIDYSKAFDFVKLKHL